MLSWLHVLLLQGAEHDFPFKQKCHRAGGAGICTDTRGIMSLFLS